MTPTVVSFVKTSFLLMTTLLGHRLLHVQINHKTTCFCPSDYKDKCQEALALTCTNTCFNKEGKKKSFLYQITSVSFMYEIYSHSHYHVSSQPPVELQPLTSPHNSHIPLAHPLRRALQQADLGVYWRASAGVNKGNGFMTLRKLLSSFSFPCSLISLLFQ